MILLGDKSMQLNRGLTIEPLERLPKPYLLAFELGASPESALLEYFLLGPIAGVFKICLIGS